jgi:adenylate cyclase
LESATKAYGVKLLICENTYHEVKDDFHCREIDTLLVKGKNIPVKVFTVTGYKANLLTDKEREFNALYNQGLQCFKEEKYQEASQSFLNALEVNPKDQPTKLFLNRCAENLQVNIE